MSRRDPGSRAEIAGLVAILALAAALRFAGLGAESLWLDEGYSVRVASGSLTDVLAGAAGDVHPPLYYLLLHGWMGLAGRSEAAVRAPSALAGLLTVALAWALGRRIAGSMAGLLAALLVALSGFQLHYSQEARSYALLGLLATLSWTFAARAVGEGRARDRLAMILASIALVYTHHAGWFAVVAQALTPLGAPRFRGPGAGRAWAGWIGAHLVVVAAWLPWLGVVRRQAAIVESLSWLPPTGPRALAGALVDHADSPWLALVILALAVVALVRASRTDAATTAPHAVPVRVAGLWFAIPILLPFLISWAGRPFFLSRLTIAADVPLAVLAAAGVVALPRRAQLGALALLALLAAQPFVAYEIGPHRERWREAVAELERDARPGDRVLFDAGYCLRDVWGYYARRRDLDLRPLPPSSGSAVFASEADRAASASRVWLVRSHDGEAGEEIARRLAREHRRVLERRYESVTYELWRPRRYLGVRVERFERPAE
jgi:mannosyltransferase